MRRVTATQSARNFAPSAASGSRYGHGMKRLRKFTVLLLSTLMAAPTGCQWGNRSNFKGETDKYFEALATSIEYPAESACTLNSNDPALAAPPPPGPSPAPPGWHLPVELDFAHPPFHRVDRCDEAQPDADPC